MTRDGWVDLRVGMVVVTGAAEARVGEVREIVAWPGIVRARYVVTHFIADMGIVRGEIVEVLDGEAGGAGRAAGVYRQLQTPE